MNRTVKSIIAVFFVLIIVFCANIIMQTAFKRAKIDVTEQKIYSLSDGTKNILAKLNQPLTLKLYYAKTAALKGPDQIKFFNIYYEFVKSLLEEYDEAGGDNINLEVIDPRPFSDDETAALGYGLRKFPITEEENFFFGLVVQTQFGVEKTIPFFAPERQNFVEYDISYLIDTAITRTKKKIGVISSLPVLGDDVSGYMAQMMAMQGQQPAPAWTFIEQLKGGNYEVSKVEDNATEINDVDLLMVIHPKDLSESLLFAIDQFIVGGGRALIFTDPYAYVDQPDPQARMSGQMPEQSSSLNSLLAKWGVEMKEGSFAGDKSLAIKTAMGPNQSVTPLIGYLNLTGDCFNKDNAISSSLNDMRVLFAGVLEDKQVEGVSFDPILSTTVSGNSWTAEKYELMMPNPQTLMNKFTSGDKPVTIAAVVSGKFETNFPHGIDVEPQTDKEAGEAEEKAPKEPKHLEPSVTSGEDCAVAVFADVDFISDMLAYRDAFFGSKMAVGDNAAALLNTIEHISGSGDLLKIRSRGTHKRRFTVVDEIELKAQASSAEEEAKIQAEINGFQTELQQILSNAKEGQEEVVGSSIINKKKEIELKIRQAQARLQDVKLQRRQDIEALENRLRNINLLLAPSVILLVAVVLAMARASQRRRYMGKRAD
jgi:ABC-type uncharacterized transport system involved in gliding motility auxiliary subunit